MNKKILLFLLTAAMVMCLLPTAFAADGAHACDSANGTYCIVCDVAEKINALPAASEITVDNAAEVTDKIHAIDRIKGDLTDSQYEELLTLVECGNDGSGYGADVPVRYMEAVEAIRQLGGNTLAVTKKFAAADGSIINVDNAEVKVLVTNVETGESVTLTLATMHNTLGTLSADANFYSMNDEGDGWTYCYPLPAGTYRVEEVSYSGATVDGEEFVTTEVSYNGVVGSSTTVTFADGASDRINISMTNAAHPAYYIDAKDESGNALSGVEMTIQGVTEPDFTHSWTTDGSITTLSLINNREYTLTVTAVPDGYAMPSPASVTFVAKGDGSEFTDAFAIESEIYTFNVNVTVPTAEVGASVTLNFKDRDGAPLAIDGDYSYYSMDENGDYSYTVVDSYTNCSSYTMTGLADGLYSVSVFNVYGDGYSVGGFIEFKVEGGKVVEEYDAETDTTLPYSNSHTILSFDDSSLTIEVASIMYDFSINVLGIDAALPYEVKDADGNVVAWSYIGEVENPDSYSVHLNPGKYTLHSLGDPDFETIINFPAENEYLEFTVNEDYTITVDSSGYNTEIEDFGGSYCLKWFHDSTDSVTVTATVKTTDGTNFPENTSIALYVETGYDEELGETYYNEVQSIAVPTDVSEFTYTWTVASYRTEYGEDGEIDLIENSYTVKGTDCDWNEFAFDETETNVFEATIDGSSVEVEFYTMADAGYYAETSESENKVGAIALNAQIANIDAISDRVVKYGMLLYKNGFSEAPEIDDGSSDVEQLSADGGYYHSIVKNITEEEFEVVFYAIPFAVVDADGDFETTDDQTVHIGEVVSASVSEYNAWLGATNPY